MKSLSDLKKGDHIHMMGICGTAMGSLAGIFNSMGFKVSGSDKNVYPPMSTQLKNLGISIMQDYKAENLKDNPDFVIVGNVISKHFEEAEELLKKEIPYTSLPQAIGEYVIANRHSIVLTGTHGKTTTTSMMTWIAECCDKAPGYLIGGVPENFDYSFRAPEASDYFVIEGDEYDTAFFDKVPKFLHYRPKSLVITSLEFDHADIYDDLEHIKKGFIKLVAMVPEDGVIIYNSDDKNIQDVITRSKETIKAKLVSYGEGAKSDYKIINRDVVSGRNQFSIEYKGKNCADIAIKLMGSHNAMNATAAFVVALENKWPEHKIMQALASFKGVKRRQQILGQPNDILVLEDFAHHPTAVKLTIEALKETYKDKKLWAVFEPRSATSRRSIFQEDYIEAFKKADVAIISKAFNQESLAEDNRLSSEKLCDDIKKSGTEASFCKTTDEIIKLLKTYAKPGDIIVLMSNGSFGGIYPELLKALGN